MDKLVVDDWGQCRKGLPYGALRRHVDEGRLHEGNLHAELGQIVAGLRPGRERDDETILVRENESVYIPLGAVHRLENPETTQLLLPSYAIDNPTEVGALLPSLVALKVDPNATAEEDPYADPKYQVPDDLVW